MTNDKNRWVWRKSSYSSGQGNCVEVAISRAAIGIRDSKDPSGPVLSVRPEEWGAFVRMLKHSAK